MIYTSKVTKIVYNPESDIWMDTEAFNAKFITSDDGNNCQTKMFFSISQEGKVTLGKDVQVDEVAQFFFEQLQKHLEDRITKRRLRPGSDEDVIANLLIEIEDLKEENARLEDENIKYHNALLCLYNIVRCMKIDEKVFEHSPNLSNLEVRDLVRVMENAEKMLREENRN